MIDLEFYEFLENNKNQVWFSSYMKCLKENEINSKKYKRQIDNYIYKALISEKSKKGVIIGDIND